jgi:23S rRNA pseudouridine1911/1915/1917 synthase
MVVHPAAGNYRGTLVAGLLSRFVLAGGEPTRPGIVHRLDKDTSGLLVVAKSLEAHEGLARQFREHTVGRRYRAVVRGVPDPERGTLKTPYGRHPRHRVRFSSRYPADRQAVTHYEVRERFGRLASQVTCELETGRTHQVRVHMADMGHPVLGDDLYGGRSGELAPALKHLDRQALHAELLAFDHPVTGLRVELEAPLPEDLQRVLEILRSMA